MENKSITSPTAAKIYAEWMKEGRAERPRTYLGASIIGHDCDMYLWLYFRGVARDNFDGRMYRLFDRGKREEAVFCNDLRRIGCEVKEFDDKGSQWSVSALGGHFGGHLDGIVRGLAEAPKAWHVVEFKTHSDSSFKKLCKDGVAKAKPMHYAQMQVYMGLTGLDRALYMAVNKDNDDLWVERIEFSKTVYGQVMDRAKHIIDTCEPERCAKRPDDYRCKACPCASACWHTAKQFVDPLIPETCRTCCHATADTEHDGAGWVCRKGHSCSIDGCCDDYLILPLFVKGEIADGNDSNITYSFNDDGVKGQFTIGRDGYATSEAKKIEPRYLAGIDVVKKVFPDSKVVGADTLARKYSGEKYKTTFEGTVEGLTKFLQLSDYCDWSKPTMTEEVNGVLYCEYADYNTLVVIDEKHNIGKRIDDIPF